MSRTQAVANTATGPVGAPAGADEKRIGPTRWKRDRVAAVTAAECAADHQIRCRSGEQVAVQKLLLPLDLTRRIKFGVSHCRPFIDGVMRSAQIRLSHPG